MKRRLAIAVRAGGFTLLEVCLAMGLMGILATGIYALASGSVQLSAELVEYQDDEAIRRRFIELCRANIESLPGHSRIELETAENGRYYTTYLSLIEHPSAFAFANSRFDVKRVVLASEVASSGFLDVRLHYLDTDADLAWQQGNTGKALDLSQDIRLLDRLRQAGWRFYEPRQQLWFDRWEENQGRPGMVELTLEFEGDPGPERLVFFVPASEGAGAGGTGFSIQQIDTTPPTEGEPGSDSETPSPVPDASSQRQPQP